MFVEEVSVEKLFVENGLIEELMRADILQSLSLSIPTTLVRQ